LVAISFKSINGSLENCGCFKVFFFEKETSYLILLSRDLLFLCFGIIIILFNPHKHKQERG
jgi:hypothetical protein